MKTIKACVNWERDLQTELTEAQWEHISMIAHKGSLNVSIQENNYKILMRWYRTPVIIHKYYPTLSDKCWRCTIEVGTLEHIWWSCPLIQPFWTQVRELTSQISTYTLEHTSAQCRLHHSDIPVHQYRKTLIPPLLNAAKLCIPLHWGTTNAPTIPEWLKRVEKIAEMEELIAIAKDCPTKFSYTWACWSHFCTTDQYKQLTNQTHTDRDP